MCRELRIGASGFLTKDVTPDDLRHAMRVVAAGEALLTPAITGRVIGEFAGRAAVSAYDRDRLASLTDREREVVRLVAEGLSNEEIGARLFMSPLTAKTLSAEPSPSWAYATACSWSSSLTKQASSSPKMIL